MKILFSFLITILTFLKVSAHQDFQIVKDYGNVRVAITTGFDYEEIQKVFIIGQLAQKLSKELDYSKPLVLYFHHHYVFDIGTNLFIGFEKSEVLKRKSLVIRQCSKIFDAASTLKALEYAIREKTLVKANQKRFKFEKGYIELNVTSIDTTTIQTTLAESETPILKSTLSKRIDRPDDSCKECVSYFLKNNKCYLFYRDYYNHETILLELDNIYQFKKINKGESLIFDTDSTFYYQQSWPKPVVSKRQQIENKYKNYRPYRIVDIDGDKISISFRAYTNEAGVQPRVKNLLYLINEERLIQDLDKLLLNSK